MLCLKKSIASITASIIEEDTTEMGELAKLLTNPTFYDQNKAIELENHQINSVVCILINTCLGFIECTPAIKDFYDLLAHFTTVNIEKTVYSKESFKEIALNASKLFKINLVDGLIDLFNLDEKVGDVDAIANFKRTKSH